ncbi:hypothetical protein SORBI_3005G012700 [Sorghum bicolor]|uniref:DUF4220 domain-containing protein n=2 Tax=Sorghum bicolor TaxID=4558 RepID=A0A1Z5RGJ8_SORBI|nr:hypothetical protein SORBI_3005G012700 [Sorghum bicolor]
MLDEMCQGRARALGLRCKELIDHGGHTRHQVEVLTSFSLLAWSGGRGSRHGFPRASKQAMAMARVLHLWNEWEIQILVLVSFALQVLLLSFAWMRRRSISRVLRVLLWLMYLLAEYTATYTLGHMSIAGKAGEHQQLMAFWAPFLLMHLGGQDTITAYAMEDSQLWLRHLLTFAVQALGAGYVLYKYIGRSGPLATPAVLLFTVGVLKNAERVWALSFSRLEIIRRYMDSVSIDQVYKAYPGAECLERQPKRGTWDFCLGLAGLLVWRKPTNSKTPNDNSSKFERIKQLDDESVLQGAHDLLYICMGQFVDDKIWPSEFQRRAMDFFHLNGKTFQLVEMQLSMMYDIFYTKAAVIHTWYGRCFRVISLLGTAMAFFLFQFSTGKDHYNRVDATVTYILVTGAFILEAASVLRAMGSTWTCALLREREWARLHSLHVSLRRYVRIAQARRWSDSIGQLNLLDSYSYTGDKTSIAAETSGDEEEIFNKTTSRGSLIGEIFNKASLEEGNSRLPQEKDKGGGFVQEKDKRGSLGRKLISFWKHGGGSCSSRISTAAKELVLQEIRRLVDACKGKEGVMGSYRGQCALEQRRYEPDDDEDGLFLKDLTWSTSMEFDQSILTWHLATHKFLKYSESTTDAGSLSLVEATKAVSNYMMFLLVECPYMLPSPVRPTLHVQAKKVLREQRSWERFITRDRTTKIVRVIDPGAKLADELLHIEDSKMPGPNELLRVVFGVWVEMLCYAAHHCSRESHARQLNNGGEFITTVWLLTTAEFNRVHCSLRNFKDRKHSSIFMDFMACWSALILWFSSHSMQDILRSCWSALISWYSLVIMAPVLISCRLDLVELDLSGFCM